MCYNSSRKRGAPNAEKNSEKQMKLFSGTLEELMPKEHFPRDLDRFVDFDFVYEKVEKLYSKTGRPSLDPVVLIKMLLIGYLYGIVLKFTMKCIKEMLKHLFRIR